MRFAARLRFQAERETVLPEHPLMLHAADLLDEAEKAILDLFETTGGGVKCGCDECALGAALIAKLNEPT